MTLSDRDEKGRFIKGKAPGPGRKKYAIPLADVVREALNLSNKDKPDFSNLEVLIQTLIELGLEGNIPAIQMLFDRGYGKAVDIIQINKGEEPDLSLLTDEELNVYFSLLSKVTNEQSSFIQ